MQITDDHIVEGLLVANLLFDVVQVKNDLKEIIHQCVYLIYGEKL